MSLCAIVVTIGDRSHGQRMSLVRLLFLAGYVLITLSFAVCGFALVWFALLEIWYALDPAGTESARERFNTILESIGLLTIATASLELGQTVLEEEIQRKTHTSTPTRVRRFPLHDRCGGIVEHRALGRGIWACP